MKEFFDLFSPSKRIALISGVLSIGIIFVIDLFVGIRNFEDAIPYTSALYIIRTVFVFVSVIAIILSLLNNNVSRFIIDTKEGALFQKASIIVTLLFSAVTLYLFLFKPIVFNNLSKEDNFIEWTSALFLFVSCFIALYTLLRFSKSFGQFKVIRYSILLLSIAYFVMAMEEVSWFQRVLEIKTPEAFESNLQEELNLHNFATNIFEHIFYFGTFILLVVLPAIRFLYPSITNVKFLNVFIARPYMAIIGAVASAYNFDTWNNAFTQIAFFSSIVGLCIYLFLSKRNSEKYIVLFSVVLILVSQVMFFKNSSVFDRIYEITEYKEFFIEIALLIYSLEVYIQTKILMTKEPAK